MTNEEIAMLAQSGNEKSVLLLWERVKYFAKKQAVHRKASVRVRASTSKKMNRGF